MAQLPDLQRFIDLGARRLRLATGALALACMSGAAMASERETEEVVLPPPGGFGGMPLEAALNTRRSIRDVRPEAPLKLAEIGALVHAAQGITDRQRGRRASPSAGRTYPLELRVVTRGPEPPAGIYRYLPDRHVLVREREGDHRRALARAARSQEVVSDAPVVLVISAVHARTRSRYGERAERYVAMEAGHAAQNVYLLATAMGLGTVVIGAFDDERLAGEMGLPAREAPLYLMPVAHPRLPIGE